ncbi:uncharacterized protein LOC126924275 isoform X1 [Bombus affinis]|uniref:uncharacterized protein LOC126924275 isoform X1 n=1 Tax=Bombus affinis TaxID=309941 RepID=UPI0021B7E4D7|nr:uncharacterized protein LOC126924275 isoform X1 [Bombus affinis]XP_050594530.1 uncharacterized protein LOC126924275 isoform X1 [Bombus affinis]
MDATTINDQSDEFSWKFDTASACSSSLGPTERWLRSQERFSEPLFPPLDFQRLLPDVSFPDDIRWDSAASMTILVTLVLMSLAVASSQDYSQLFAGFGPYLRQSAVMRDPRSNRGPVLFPPGPPPNSADTSGVIVGASGYGFVPPNQAFYRYFYY